MSVVNCFALFVYHICFIILANTGVAAHNRTPLKKTVNPAKYYSNPAAIYHFMKYDSVSWFRMERGLDECHKDDIRNQTLLELDSYLKICVNRNWLPVELGATMVSWKNVKDENETRTKAVPVGKKRNNAIPSALAHTGNVSNFSQAEDSSGALPQTISELSTEEHKEDLLFAIILPGHPYSHELLKSLAVVGPLFPQLTGIVYGNGLEFTEMCMKYNIKSFPKLILFREGKLFKVYKGENYEVKQLATVLSRWLRVFPAGRPYYDGYDGEQDRSLGRNRNNTGLHWRKRTVLPSHAPHSLYALYENILNSDDGKLFETRGNNLDGENITSADNLYDSYSAKCRVADIKFLDVLLFFVQWICVRCVSGDGQYGSWFGAGKDTGISVSILKECFNLDIIVSLVWYRFPGVGPTVEPIVGYLPEEIGVQAEFVIYSLSGVYSMVRFYQYISKRYTSNRVDGINIVNVP